MKDVQVKKIIEVSVSNQQLVAKTPCRLVAGTRGLYAVRVTYDDEWNETPHILLQFNGYKTKEVDIRDASEPIDVPWECIEEACYLSLALLGMDGNGELKLTTYSRNNNSLIVYPKDWRDKGEDDEDRDPLPPTPTIWEDLKEQLSEKADAEDVEKAIGELEEEIAKKADAQEVNNKFSGIEEQLNKKVGSEELTNAIDDLSNDIQKDFEAIEDELGKKVNSEDIQDILDDVDNTIQEEIKELDNKIDGKADTETVNIGFENISKQLVNKADAKTVQDGFDGLEEEISKKADAETVQNALNGLGTEIAKKADSETVQSSLNELSAEVAKKANTESVQGVIDEISGDLERCAEAILKVNDDVNNKANIDDVEIAFTQLENEIDKKATITEVQEIENKVNKNIEDIEQLSEKADAIINSASGETISVNDSSVSKPSIKTYGKSVQNQYEGNQLWNGGEFDISAGGSVSGYAYAPSELTEFIKNLPLGTYSVSYTTNGTGTKGSYYGRISLQLDSSFLVQSVSSFVLTEEIKNSLNKVALYGYLSQTQTVKDFMLNVGSTVLPYEPYVGNAPSPSIDYPQEINSCGDGGSIKHGIYTSQLLKHPYLKDEYMSNGITATVQNDGSLLVNGTATATAVIELHSYNSMVLSAGTYFPLIINRKAGVSVRIYTEENPSSPQNGKFTLLSNCGIRYIILIQSGVSFSNEIMYPMLNIGDTVLPYEPYTEQTLTLSTPNGLRGIPVSSGGNYTDTNGQQWVADEIDLEQGKRIQRIYCLKLSEDLLWTHRKTNNNNYNCQILLSSNGFPMHDNSIRDYQLSSKFTHFILTNTSYDEVGLKEPKAYVNGNEVTISFPSNSEMITLEIWKQFLADNDVYAYYILAEPIVTDISAEELEQYEALHMNYPNTTIINDADAYMNVEYVADTKNYINNIHAEMQALKTAIVALGGAI